MSITDLFSLEGKTALVTGCRRGIGRAMAVGLAEAGAEIVGVSRSLEQDSAVGREISGLGRRFYPYRCDLGDREALYRFIEEVHNNHPQIDILVNNAGTIRRGPAAVHKDADWDAVIEVNLNAQFILSREFGRLMAERGAGKIIFTASILSFQGGINVPGYAAAKHGLAGLTRALANEWAGRGVQVNAIAPGYIDTDIVDALKNDPERSRAILERIPAGRWGKPDDLKGPVVFLASHAADFVSGEIVTVDGGWMGR